MLSLETNSEKFRYVHFLQNKTDPPFNERN